MSAYLFSPDIRRRNLESMERETFDLVIIGGGITGAGAARDAASRGMSVALIEACDFAFGTSSRSSKLIHGGIRYLENLEFGLVFEALNERQRLFEIAPHLVHPLRFLLPMYADGRVGMFKMGLGMFLYDALALFDSEPHDRLDQQEALTEAPLLKHEGLRGAYVYSDGYMDDDRLVIETLRSASSLGAKCANYTRAIGVEMNSSRVTGIRCRDEMTKRPFVLRGRHVISSVGPWTDEVGSEFFPNWKKILRPTKGIHLTLDRKRIPISKAIVLADDARKRIVFVIPRHEMIIVGTTDTNYTGDPADVRVEKEDVVYLLDIVEEYFPGAKLTKNDLIGAYAGVRPLIRDESETESQTSREHKIFTNAYGVTFVAGGKYTTYRHMAEQVVNEALSYFKIEERIRFSKPETKTPLIDSASPQALARAHTMISTWAREFKFSEQDVRELVERHGMEAEEMLRLASEQDWNTLWQVEADHAIRNGMCLTLEDFWFRRVRLFLALRDHGIGYLRDVIEVFSRRLKWSDVVKRAQEESLRAAVEREMAWKKHL